MLFIGSTSLPLCLPLIVASVCTSMQDVPEDVAHEKMLGESIDYLSDVKPILLRRCYACHGPDGDARKAKLRLDDRADVMRPRFGDMGVIVPGDASESELFFRISSDDEEMRMPLEGEPLSPEQVETIRRWIEQGAQYDRHWSFVPIRDPASPAVDSAHVGLVRDPIDAFVLARMEERGLQPAGDAPPAVQVRRLAFDLTGLPPACEDVAKFENNPSDEAWNALVEKYLASEDYGERWARHWLDLTRYAETFGHEFDFAIADAWRYRDYVIRAFNDDVPYDRLLREHVAGDLIDPRIDPVTGVNQAPLATGFWHLHQAVHGPVDVRADELERFDNQIDVFSKAFMGLTVSCARCHDHKFDPILQSDYYGLTGYMKSSRRNRTYLDPHGEITAAREAIRTARVGHVAVLEDAAAGADGAELRRLLEVLLAAVVEEGTPGAIATETVFEDFEGPDFGAWTVEGNAFARGPQDSTSVRDVFVPHTKSRCVNTCDDRPGASGDDDTGTLTSPPFQIRHRAVRFTLSGGNFPSETCIELLVDGKVVQTSHGQSDIVPREFEWDISELEGKEARIRIRDTRTGGWGHVVVDDLRFGDLRGFGSSLSMPVESLCEKIDLSKGGVEAWFAAVHDRTDPMRPWFVPSEGGPAPSVVFDDGTGTALWFGDGHAWQECPSPPLASGLDDPRLHGTIRSRTFQIHHDHVLLRVRGQGTIRVTVDGFMMDEFNPLLFEGLKHDINEQDWRVVVINVSSYTGERAWVELVDDIDGSLEVDWIALDDRSEARVALDGSSGAGYSWNDPEVVRWLVKNDLLNHLPTSAQAFGVALRRDVELARETVPELPTPLRALTLQDGFTEEERILLRGNHETPGEPASRGLVEIISGPLEHDSSGSGRERLVEALLDPENSLTTRVLVNRLWHHLTGRGIVRTTDNFGGLGAMPTHPYLLDHLATDFALDLSIKRMIGRIVRSSTYRRSAIAVDEQVALIDPTNEYLARARIRRIQGEAIRDAMLQVSGRLDSKRFGPPVAIHLTPFMTGRGRPGENGPLDGNGRRSIYLEVRRNFPNPFLSVFDLPVPTTTMGTRNVSNVPAQALAMMNDPFVHEMSQSWGSKAQERGELPTLWREALAREASQEELDRARMFLEDQGGGREAWIALCHAILNTKEFTHLN